MESAQIAPGVRRPWEKPAPPKVRRPSYLRRPSMGNRMPSIAQSVEEHRVRFLNFLPLAVKNHIIAVASEFAGTFMFLLFALGGTNAVNQAPQEGQPTDLAANPAKLLFISLCFGMSLAVNAWVFFRISGGLFNPAVSLGMMVIGAIGYVRGVLIIISQIAGGIAASAVLLGIQPGELTVGTSLGGGTSTVQGLFIEMFLTAQLVFTIFMLAAEKHRATFIAPIGIGLSLFIAELMGVYYTGGSLNPARSFGPNVVVANFEHYHWIYWVGPIMGSLLASAFYTAIKALEYETVNPEQDHSGEADATRSIISRKNTNNGPETENHVAPVLHRLASAGTAHTAHTAGTNGTGGTGGTTGAGEQRVPLSRGSTAVRSYGDGPILEAGQG